MSIRELRNGPGWRQYSGDLPNGEVSNHRYQWNHSAGNLAVELTQRLSWESTLLRSGKYSNRVVGIPADNVGCWTGYTRIEVAQQHTVFCGWSQ